MEAAVTTTGGGRRKGAFLVPRAAAPTLTEDVTRKEVAMWIDQRGSEIIERPEALRLLSVAATRRDHGRLGVTIVGNPDEAPLVVPVDFVVDDHRVLVRLGPGRLCELTVGRLVAFEVDEVDRSGGTAWSILVRGLASELTVDDIAALGDAVPAPSVPDPGHRIVAIRLDAVTGRRFTVSPAEPPTVAGATS
ncbi:MAG: pyridoxamine 5'-phosphate oxidase family protein [Actinomycetota bacterium]|nr:pyridoxamine 5'-phosphate oxidase family protein [Actinomycetota bacterium]MDA8294228.1 pyridoxamine 5'-phosphate oxidase family protein [Actinomycetota bacterium]